MAKSDTENNDSSEQEESLQDLRNTSIGLIRRSMFILIASALLLVLLLFYLRS